MEDWLVGFTGLECTHEPPKQHALGWAPLYTQPIRVIDSLIETLTGDRRRRRWRNLRDEALEVWEMSGLRFTIERGPGIVWEDSWMDPQWPTYFTKNAITFVQQPPGKALGNHVQWADTSAGVVGLGIKEWDYWWKPYRFREVSGILIHEFGHTLGFGHGGDGVMMGLQKPDEVELESVRTYYNS